MDEYVLGLLTDKTIAKTAPKNIRAQETRTDICVSIVEPCIDEGFDSHLQSLGYKRREQVGHVK